MAIKSVLKKIGATVLGAGSSLIIAACYGVYYGDWMSLATGNVRTADGTGIPEIEVCVQLSYESHCESTDANGDFAISSWESDYNEADRDGFTLQARDVDGAINGEWADEDVSIDPGNAGGDFDITMDPAVN